MSGLADLRLRSRPTASGMADVRHTAYQVDIFYQAQGVFSERWDRAHLRGADLLWADLREANLSEAELSRANLHGEQD